MSIIKNTLLSTTILAVGSASAMAAGNPAYTPGEAVITKDMVDPVVDSIISTLGTVGAAAFLLLGFGVSMVIGFRVVKSLFKTAST